MDFSLFKNLDLDKALDKAFDLEKVGGSVFSVVEEFPDRGASAIVASGRPLSAVGADGSVLTAASVARARQGLAAWEELDLEGRKPEWEALCERVKQAASSSSGSGSSSAEAWERRAKDAEYQLVQTISLLLTAPDPVPYFQSVATLSARVVEVEEQNRQLAAVAASASADAAEVQKLVEEHRALQAAHKELQERVQQQEQELGSSREAAAAGIAATAELAAQTAEIGRLQASLKTLREEYERSQSTLFDVLAKQEQEAGGRASEMELVMEELERSHGRVRELQQQLAEAREAQHGQANASARDSPVDDFWERQLQVKADQIAALQQQLEAAAAAARDQEAREKLAAQQMANRIAALELDLEKCEAELSRRPDKGQYEEVLARVAALSQLVDGAMEAEGWGMPGTAAAAVGTAQGAQALLQERNRKLASEVSSLRLQLQDQKAATAAAEQLGAAAAAEQLRLQALVSKLENHLLQGTRAGAGAAETRGESGNLTGRKGAKGPATTVEEGEAVQGEEGPASGPGAGVGGREEGRRDEDQRHGSTDADAPPVRPATPDTADKGGDGAGSLLDIIASQRDRFRQRATQLEEENGKLMEELGKVRRQLDECRADNVGLFEKVRYLERYSQQQAAGSGRVAVLKVDGAGVPQAEAPDPKANRYQCGPLAFEFGAAAQAPSQGTGAGPGAGPGITGGPMAGVRSRGGRKSGGRLAACFPTADEGDEEAGTDKYARAYEARVNPFTEFQRSEAEQRVKGLQLHERAVLAGSKLAAGSRFARAFIAVYAVLLHLFVLLLLYYALHPVTRVEVIDSAMLQQQQQQQQQGVAGASAGV